METCTTNRQSQDRKEGENDACWRSDRSISPLLVAPIWGIGLHTHTHTHTHALYLHKETEIGLLIALRQADLKGQQRSLYRGTCLVTVTANRKTIGDLNSNQPSPQ